MTTQKTDTLGARLLSGTSFTPAARTPWGGARLRALKSLPAGEVVGEAWELSVEPDFPSLCEDGRALADLLQSDPARWLGREAARGSTALLLKLLDAREPLSLQIHPPPESPELGPGESGKPEAWYVFDHAPGAGLFLGLAEGVGPRDVERALAGAGSLEPLLFFTPVARGDFFVIDAGTPHSIGAGVTLVEPQYVLPGKRGVTYRYWDWGRVYDGKPRPLHVAQALAVTAWDAPRGEALLAARRLRAGMPDTSSAARVEPLAGPEGPIDWDWLRVSRLAGTGALHLEPAGYLRALTVLEGAVDVGSLRVPAGRTAALAAADAFELTLRGAHAILASVAS